MSVQDYLSYPLCPFDLTKMTEVPLYIQKITILNYNPDTDTYNNDLSYQDFSSYDSTQFPTLTCSSNDVSSNEQVLPILIIIDNIEYRTPHKVWKVLSEIARSAVEVNSMRKKLVFPIYIRAGLHSMSSLLNETVLYYRPPCLYSHILN